MYRISYNGGIVSEGQGYGMIITAIMPGHDSVSKRIASKISNWVNFATRGNIDVFYAGYNLDGTAFANYSDISFTAPIGVAAMCTKEQTWLNHIYASVRTRRAGTYYEDSLILFAYLS